VPSITRALHLSAGELDAAQQLNAYRELIDHPKPTQWSLAAEDVRSTLANVLPVVRKLMDAVAHHYEARDRKEVDAAIGVVRICSGIDED